MPLFECSRCGTVDNTALGEYWKRLTAPLCSECRDGKWHGHFDKHHISETEYVRQPDSFIVAPEGGWEAQG